jgi:RimJ/RimL family protein N-acetyltransferase
MQSGWVAAHCDDDLSFTQQTPDHIATHKSPRAANASTKPSYKLRAWGTSDVDTYLSLLDDPDVWRYMPEDYPNPISHDLAIALIELSNASNHHQVFAVERHSKPVGQVRLEYDVEPNNPACAEISYWVGKRYWNQGIGSDMVDLFTARCLRDNMGLTSLIARVHRDNVCSLKVLEKAGYTVEGPDANNSNWIKLRLMRDA